MMMSQMLGGGGEGWSGDPKARGRVNVSAAVIAPSECVVMHRSPVLSPSARAAFRTTSWP